MNFSAKKQFLTLPDGRVLEDAFYYPDFVQNILGVDVNAAFENIREYPSWPDNEQIPFRPDGGDVHWIKGTHPSLSYRGHQLRLVCRALQIGSGHQDGTERTDFLAQCQQLIAQMSQQQLWAIFFYIALSYPKSPKIYDPAVTHTSALLRFVER